VLLNSGYVVTCGEVPSPQVAPLDNPSQSAPASIKVVDLPCTGKFDVLYALRAFEDGADGVMVAG